MVPSIYMGTNCSLGWEGYQGGRVSFESICKGDGKGKTTCMYQYECNRDNALKASL